MIAWIGGALVVGVIAGAVGGIKIDRRVQANDARVTALEADARKEEAQARQAEATTATVGAAVQGQVEGIEAAQAPQLVDAETRRLLAQMEPAAIATRAAVAGASPRTRVALAAYLGGGALSMGKGEGAAAYELQDRSADLTAALEAESACPEPAQE